MSLPSPPRTGNRTLWIVVGVMAFCGILCCGGGALIAFNGYKSGVASDKEAKAFAEQAITAIGKEWSDDQLKHYAAPAFLPSVGSKNTILYLSTWKKTLGALKSHDQFTTEGIYFGSHNGLPPATRIQLSAPTIFEKGTGVILLGVAKAENTWGIKTINIQSDLLRK